MIYRLLICLLFFSIHLSVAQVDNTHPVVEKLHGLTFQNPVEKTYMHFDKPYYAPGETIWFKAYITLGGDHIPSPQGGLLYVNFFNDQNQPIEQVRLQCTNGFGHGQLSIPDTLSTSQIRVSAYTPWMRNFDESFFFQKSLPLIGAPAAFADSSAELSVGIYPEGGQLIADIGNRVALKTSPELRGKTLTLTDADNEALKEIAIDDRGYGLFDLIPSWGKRYFVSYGNEKFELPPSQEEGVAIRVNAYSYPDAIRMTLFKKRGSTPENVFILIHTRGTVHYSGTLDFSRALTLTNIPTAALPAGVNHLTVFDQSGTPLAERLFYIDREEPASLNIQTPDIAVGTRKKVTLELSLSEKGSAPKSFANLSLTATQQPEIQRNPDSQSIKTYLLLNSDLRGHIPEPGYYFTDITPEKKKALDLVLMTHGWRRFTWENLLNQPLDSIQYQPQSGTELSGRLLRKGNNKPIANGTVTYLNRQNGQMTMRTEQTDDEGKFVLTDLLHTNLSKVSLKGIITDKGQKRARKQFVIFELDTATETLKTDWLIPADPVKLSSPEVEAKILSNTEKRELYDSLYNFDPDVRIVEGITVETEKAKDFTRLKESPAYSKGTITYEVPDEPRMRASRDILSLLTGKVAGLLITPGLNPANTVVEIRGANRIGEVGGVIGPKFMLNDMESDLQTIVYLPVDQIDRVEIYKGPDAAIFGIETIGGVIAVYTKSGFEVQEIVEAEEGLYSIPLPGLQVARQYFSPDYSAEKPEHVKPDIRNLIHWQPVVITDSTGKATVEFWTSDNTGTIDIEIEGLTSTGQPIVKKTTIHVKKED